MSYDIYVKGAGLHKERLYSVGIVGLGEEGFEFSGLVDDARAVHYAELFGISFVLDKLDIETRICFFLNNQGLIGQVKKMKREWEPKFKGQGFFHSMIDEIAPKESVFSSVEYGFIRKDNEHILRARDLARKVLE